MTFAHFDLSLLALSILAGLVGVVATCLVLFRLTRSATDFDGPPGTSLALCHWLYALSLIPIPWLGYPILGNWDVIGRHHLWHLLEEWSKIYG